MLKSKLAMVMSCGMISPHKKSHKDIDAYGLKREEIFYGYKNHAKVDTKSKFDAYVVTDASLHDSQPLDDLLNEKDEDQVLHSDSTYSGEPCAEIIAKRKILGLINLTYNLFRYEQIVRLGLLIIKN